LPFPSLTWSPPALLSQTRSFPHWCGSHLPSKGVVTGESSAFLPPPNPADAASSRTGCCVESADGSAIWAAWQVPADAAWQARRSVSGTRKFCPQARRLSPQCARRHGEQVDGSAGQMSGLVNRGPPTPHSASTPHSRRGGRPYRGRREQVSPAPISPALNSLHLSRSSQIQGGGALIRVCSCFGLRSVRLLVYADGDANCVLDGMPELLPDQDPAEIGTR
jgi:hypothetical protein